MRWNYNDEYRDEFSKGPHRDILIVPHGTKVTPVAGGPPEITSRVPLFNDDGTPQTDGQGNFIMSDVDWVITNKDIVKEQFKYSYSLNPAENITFSSASSAMVQFTIRNNKEYNPDTDTWELDIPNLQYYSYYDKNNNLIIGELEGNYIIKVYTYINGDSSTLLCLGMFRVEEDKAVDNGYNRQITAYDFMATFRDMDIFNWYKRLFDGINKLDNDYIDATNKTGEEQKKPDDYDAEVNWVRKPSKKLYPNRDGRWTIGEALQDLINNLAAFDMIVWSDDGKTAMVGGTSTNPSAVGRDYGEGCGYSGYGMPIVIDPNILDSNAKPYTPTEPGQDEYEEYGYMKILELEFYPDPSVLKSESLSMGKFLEDIGILAGRYPMIRPDKLIEDSTADYFDPRTVTDPKQTRYNTYEKCILTFKPLPTSKDDKTDAGIPKLQPEQQLDNHDIAKGFEHALFDVKDVMIVKIGMQDGEKIEYKILNKTQRKQAKTNELQTFSFSNNLFCSYLVDSSDDDEIKKLLPEYKKIKEKLFGKEKDNHNMTSGALFEDGYYNIKNRSYVPYTLTTYGDPVRDVGDRILINFEDKITGEKTQMYTYILERELSGIQKMMDTYKANGQITSPVFSNYQAGTHYQSGFGMNIQMLGYKHSYGKGSGSSQGKVIGVSPSDLVSYLRNVGIRLLDEPLTASAKFVQGEKTTWTGSNFYAQVWDDGNWDGVTPLNDDTSTHGLKCLYYDEQQQEEIIDDIKAEGSPITYMSWRTEPYPDDPGFSSAMAFYTANSKWEYIEEDAHCHNSKLNDCGYPWPEDPTKHWTIEPSDFTWGDNVNHLVVNGSAINISYGDVIYISEYYGHLPEDVLPNMRITDGYGNIYVVGTYIYPGIWVDTTSGYPDLHDNDIIEETYKHVELKWEDPGNIETWEPTPADWKGTIVIRKEDSAPKHRWDGEEIVRTTTSNKDAYKDTAYKDEDIELNKVYYYGFFPYYKKREQDGHNINFFRYTKVIKVETGVNAEAPEITNISSSANTITISYSIPLVKDKTYTSIKLYGKIDTNPKCDNTDDVIEDINENNSEITINNLQFESEYYFCIQTVCDGLSLMSNVANIITDDYTSYTFDFTGSEQTFTVPETGLYRLETWGAQGQNDDNNRGGYGSYSVGEIQLTAGQTLYINVGGQNGYNGGGNYSSGNIRNIIMPNFEQTIIFDNSLWTNDWSSNKLTPGTTPSNAKLGYNFFSLIMNATVSTESILIYENNGVQIFGMRDARNATYGGYYKYSVYIKDNGTIVAGSQYPDVYYSQAWYLGAGFDDRIPYYNSNVRSHLQALYIGFGVDDSAKLGYMVGSAKYHNGYYENTDSFKFTKISNNTGQYGVYCNSAKLYDALKKMAGET